MNELDYFAIWPFKSNCLVIDDLLLIEKCIKNTHYPLDTITMLKIWVSKKLPARYFSTELMYARDKISKLLPNINTIMICKKYDYIGNGIELIMLIDSLVMNKVYRLILYQCVISEDTFHLLANVICAKEIRHLSLHQSIGEWHLREILIPNLIDSSITGLGIYTWNLDKHVIQSFRPLINKLTYLNIAGDIEDSAYKRLATILAANPPLITLVIQQHIRLWSWQLLKKLQVFKKALAVNTNLRRMDLKECSDNINLINVLNVFQNNIGVTHLTLGSFRWLTFNEIPVYMLANRPFMEITGQGCQEGVTFNHCLAMTLKDKLTIMRYLIRITHYFIKPPLPHHVKLLIAFQALFSEQENLAMSDYLLKHVSGGLTLSDAWVQFLKIRKNLSVLEN